MNKQIFISSCVTEDQRSAADATVQVSVDIDAFMDRKRQLDMPTALAESINLSIAFLDALERDFAASSGSICIYPWTDAHGDLNTDIRVSDFCRPDEYGPLSCFDSMLITAYMSVLGIQLPDESATVVSTYLLDDRYPDVQKVIITYNNDATGEILDRTQSTLLVKLDTTNSYPWRVSFFGSYDIETDRYMSADGETVLDIRERDDAVSE